jgi:hypothetical protein
MANDPELEAMGKIYDLLSKLNEDQQIRVLDWVSSKLNLSQRKPIKQNNPLGDNPSNIDFSQFETVADMFSTISVKTTEAEKVLMVASFLQIKEEKRELISREINDILKNMGHRVSNITVAIGSLVSRKPQWMMQTRKDGNSKQAQKKYKVTTEGIKEVKRILLSTLSNDMDNDE